MGFYGSWNLILTLLIWSEVNVTSKYQLKRHFVVKRHDLVVVNQDTQTLPNFIDLCIQVTQIWSNLDYLMQYLMPAVTKKVTVSDLIMMILGHGNLNSCY